MKTDFLSQIVADTKRIVTAAQKKLPENRLREEALRPRTRRPFLQRLIQPDPLGVNIIAEIKRASPSKGVIRPGLDPANYARLYERGGAAALSVLTEPTHFLGSAEDLTTARKASTLPILRKDFLISAYQLYESSVLEADAVLLIVRILSQNQLKDYLSLCRELQLAALVEVNSERDIESASWAGAELIGINNRNLSSFETDIQTAVRMKSMLEPCQVAVAASGIRTRADIEKTKQAGIWNFLIGESLVRAQQPDVFLKALIRGGA